MGLLFTRRIDDAFVIETPAGIIRILIADIEIRHGSLPRVKVLIDAPKEYLVLREELVTESDKVRRLKRKVV